ncbi:MAG: exonuclease SbcCD subunit D [Acidimicrobiia bacterium]
MRVLHTSDWHVGKRIGRFDRLADYRDTIDEVVAIADGNGVDLVLHAGDLFDVARPPVDALDVALRGLVRLAAGGRRPVVVVAGHHDSGALFDVLAPQLRPVGVHMVGGVRRPDEGGVLELESRAGIAVVACFPFLREGRVVDLGDDAGSWYTQYADRLRRVCEALAARTAAVAPPGAATFLLSHFLVGGVKVRPGTGERALHMGEAYAASSQAIPPSFDYVALGHIHAPQHVPGVAVPAEYAGSLLQLDFGEAGEDKRVVLVDVPTDGLAKVEQVPITSGRRLARAAARWEELEADRSLDDCYLDLVVHTDGPDPELGERARQRFPLAVRVVAEYPREESASRNLRYRELIDAYIDYRLDTVGREPDEGLLEAFRSLEEEVDAAP